MNITLIVVPGTGARVVSLAEGSTVEQLIQQENLHGRDIIINGNSVLPATYQNTAVTANSEVFATGSVKGNQSQITLIVVPGTGARVVNVTDQMTVEQLIQQENLHGRDIIINGGSVLPATYQTTFIQSGSEVFATGSVKGNASRPTNAPSTTGNKSGGGRGNNAPKGK
tara:strand:- start:297 stop:803 length:507 start_codon:yes stop_codon:yes gene_type:complete